MSFNVFAWQKALRGQGLSHATRSVALELALRADTHGEAFPSLSRLCEDAGASRHAVLKALEALQGAGLLEVVERGDPAQNRASVYRLTTPSPSALSAPGDSEEAEPSAVSALAPSAVSALAPSAVSALGEARAGEPSALSAPALEYPPSALSAPDLVHSVHQPSALSAPQLPIELPIEGPTLPPSGGARAHAHAREAKPDPAREVGVWAYDHSGGVLSVMAVRSVVLPFLRRGLTPEALQEAVLGIHSLGKPVTRATVDQWLEGTLYGAPTYKRPRPPTAPGNDWMQPTEEEQRAWN